MIPLEKYIAEADRCAQEIVNAWGAHVKAGNSAYLTAEFKAVFEKACQYRTAKDTADNRRQFNCLSEDEAAQEKTTRESFAKAYKAFHEKHAAALGAGR